VPAETACALLGADQEQLLGVIPWQARQLDHAALDLEVVATDLVAGAQQSGQRADDIATFLLQATQPPGRALTP